VSEELQALRAEHLELQHKYQDLVLEARKVKDEADRLERKISALAARENYGIEVGQTVVRSTSFYSPSKKGKLFLVSHVQGANNKPNVRGRMQLKSGQWGQAEHKLWTSWEIVPPEEAKA
jgi:hypothetical protein